MQHLFSASRLVFAFSLLTTAACCLEAGTQDDGTWSMPARTYDATRYSHQTEITRANVSSLRQ